MSSQTIVAAVVGTLFATSFVNGAAQSRQSSPPPLISPLPMGAGPQTPAQVQAQAQEAAFRNGGYRAAAAITGSYVRTVNRGGDPGPSSIEQLARTGDAIVIARAVSNRGVLMPRGDQIRTQFTFKVETVLRGNVSRKNQDNIVVSISGGRVSLGEGRWAQENVPYWQMPQNGERYVLFLLEVSDSAINGENAVEAPGSQYWPAQGAKGIYRLSSDGSGVMGADLRKRSPETPSMKYKGAKPENFIQDLKAAIRAGGGHQAQPLR